MENIYYSDEDPNSNFSGDWDAACQYCGRPHREHIWKEHPDSNYKQRIVCEPQKRAIAAAQKRFVRLAKMFSLVVWVIVPLGIAILGFVNWWVGFVFFLLALCKLGWRLIESFGSPEKWIPGYASRQKEELEMRHHHYHCKRNPSGFARLRAENFENE